MAIKIASKKDHKTSVLKKPLFSRRTRFLRMSDLLFSLDMYRYPQNSFTKLELFCAATSG
jgi:hypothetical protein